MNHVQEAAVMVGKKIAELCLQKNIDKVCFDRGGNIYHGRVQVRQLIFGYKLLHESLCVTNAVSSCTCNTAIWLLVLLTLRQS